MKPTNKEIPTGASHIGESKDTMGPVPDGDAIMSLVSEQEKDLLYRKTRFTDDFLEEEETKARNKVYLVNKVNYVNFQDQVITINFKHRRYGKMLALSAKPLPCDGDSLECNWVHDFGIDQKLQTHTFENIVVRDSGKVLYATPKIIHIDQKGIRFELPETCYELNTRELFRYACSGIKVQLIQDSFQFLGVLLEFSTDAFKIEITASRTQSLMWLNHDSPVNIIFTNQNETFYIGKGEIHKFSGNLRRRQYIIRSIEKPQHRFKAKEFRSKREILTPPPDIVFRHPLTGKRITLSVIDLSGSGLSVEEDLALSSLISGLIIPDMELRFADDSKIVFRAQVMYRKITVDRQNGSWIKCGIAILDMNAKDSITLQSILHRAHNRHTYVCSDVDIDELWAFFFETGFIYPKKYVSIEVDKLKIKETYRKLYVDHPNFARHFVYQDKGRILGHMSMVRFFEKSWMIHHHAARKSALSQAGLYVLSQLGRYINDTYLLQQSHMDYVYCYYRPDNKFPERVFGGVFRNIKNKKRCSIDPFAYANFSFTDQGSALTDGWTLGVATETDLVELENYYEFTSGGLMLDAFELKPELAFVDTLKEEYKMLGCLREKYLLSFKKRGVLKAIIMINLSDIGLNLSNLTNSAIVIIIDSEGIYNRVIKDLLTIIAHKFEMTELTTLLYPLDIIDNLSIPYEKVYNLWSMGVQYSDAYFKYLERITRFIKE